MPVVARPPTVQPTSIVPRARVRAVPTPSADVGMPLPTSDAAAKPLEHAKKAAREKHQPTGDYPEGYCRTPVRTRFQKGNPGGPGRPKKDSKSQDDLMRAEFLKLQHVTEKGRRRRITTRELIPGLLIKAILQKSSPKELHALEDIACRLFPGRPADASSQVTIDPQQEREYVRQLIASVHIGELAGESADPLADFVTSVFEADEEEQDTCSAEEDHDPGDGKQTNETA